MAGNKNSGSRPIPLKVLELEGKRPSGHRPVMPPASGPPPKPAGLSPAESEHWDWLCSVRSTWLDAVDRQSMLALCQVWTAAQDCWRKMQAVGDLSYAELRCAYLQYLQRWQSLAGLFGLTPGDRARFLDQVKQTDRERSEQYLA